MKAQQAFVILCDKRAFIHAENTEQGVRYKLCTPDGKQQKLHPKVYKALDLELWYPTMIGWALRLEGTWEE